MSLTVTVAVNERPVGFLAVRRITTGEEHPLAVHRYEVRRFSDEVQQVGDRVEVEHMLGDGAMRLAQIALDATMPR